MAVVGLLSRRALFAPSLVGVDRRCDRVTASAKRAAMNMVVHAYDIFFYLSSWSTVSYIWSDQRRYLLALVAALLALALVGWLAYRVDTTRVSRR